MNKKNYQGQLLVANPSNPRDHLFGSVILLLTHNESISIGVQINCKAKELSLADVANGIGLWYEGNDPLYSGGSVSVGKVHVIHSNDWSGHSTVKINDEISVTNDISVLTAVAGGEGPEYFRACAGFWMWELGTLDRQLDPTIDALYNWEIAPTTLETVFEHNEITQWHECLEAAGREQVKGWF
jgi:hypothetical protein